MFRTSGNQYARITFSVGWIDRRLHPISGPVLDALGSPEMSVDVAASLAIRWAKSILSLGRARWSIDRARRPPEFTPAGIYDQCRTFTSVEVSPRMRPAGADSGRSTGLFGPLRSPGRRENASGDLIPPALPPTPPRWCD